MEVGVLLLYPVSRELLKRYGLIFSLLTVKLMMRSPLKFSFDSFHVHAPTKDFFKLLICHFSKLIKGQLRVISVEMFSQEFQVHVLQESVNFFIELNINRRSFLNDLQNPSFLGVSTALHVPLLAIIT
jgi:hypothetical protein